MCFPYLNTNLYRVKLTADGRQALLKLSKGDMRRALNVLQACHAAYDITGEAEIYNCTGNPHPSDIEAIVSSMLSDEFTAAFKSTSQHLLRNLVFINITVINIMKTPNVSINSLYSIITENSPMHLLPHISAMHKMIFP